MANNNGPDDRSLGEGDERDSTPGSDNNNIYDSESSGNTRGTPSDSPGGSSESHKEFDREVPTNKDTDGKETISERDIDPDRVDARENPDSSQDRSFLSGTDADGKVTDSEKDAIDEAFRQMDQDPMNKDINIDPNDPQFNDLDGESDQDKNDRLDSLLNGDDDEYKGAGPAVAGATAFGHAPSAGADENDDSSDLDSNADSGDGSGDGGDTGDGSGLPEDASGASGGNNSKNSDLDDFGSGDSSDGSGNNRDNEDIDTEDFDFDQEGEEFDNDSGDGEGDGQDSGDGASQDSNASQDAHDPNAEHDLDGIDGGQGVETGSPHDATGGIGTGGSEGGAIGGPAGGGSVGGPAGSGGQGGSSPFDSPFGPGSRTGKSASGEPQSGSTPEGADGASDTVSSPFSDNGNLGGGSDTEDSPFNLEEPVEQQTDTSPSPFDEANVADGFGEDGGGGIEPMHNPRRALPEERDNDDLAEEDSGDGGDGGGGKPPMKKGGLDPDGGGIVSPIKSLLQNPAFIAIVGVIALTLGMVTMVVTTTTTQRSGSQAAQPAVCAMGSQTNAFRYSGGGRGVPEGAFSKPVVMGPGSGINFTSGVGPRWGSIHKGNDYSGPDNTTIHAYYDGVVQLAGAATGFGGWVVIDHVTEDGATFASLYGHMYLDDIFVKPGDEVEAGEIIGWMGDNGVSTGTHLHFEIHDPAYPNYVDPTPWVDKAVNPGQTDSAQDLSGFGNDRGGGDSEDADARSETRSFQAKSQEPENARGVQNHSNRQAERDDERERLGGPGTVRNPNRAGVVAGKEYRGLYDSPSDPSNQIEKTTDEMSSKMPTGDIYYTIPTEERDEYTDERHPVMDAQHTELDWAEHPKPIYWPGHEYYHGRWVGSQFIWAKEDIANQDIAPGGFQVALDALKEDKRGGVDNGPNGFPDILEENGRVAISVTDSKRYKPDYMPYEPEPGPKPKGWVPWNERNWVDAGWFVEDRGWVANPWYVHTAKYRTIDQQHPGWREVGRKEISDLIAFVDEFNDTNPEEMHDVQLFWVTGPGGYGVGGGGEDDRDGDNTVDYIDWGISEGIIDPEHVVEWDEFATNQSVPEYDTKYGGAKYDGSEKYVDAIRTIVWDEDRRMLPNTGQDGFEYGIDSKLPADEYESPYRDEIYAGNVKMKGYEGGYKINDADKLTHDAMAIAQAIQEKYPEVQSIGGWRDDPSSPDHYHGLAVDVMIPDYATTKGDNLGKSINNYIQDNHEWFNVKDTIWQQKYYPAGGEPQPMEDRGSDTQNHYDHVHISVNPPGMKNKGEAKPGPRNAGGYETADESYYYGPFPGFGSGGGSGGGSGSGASNERQDMRKNSGTEGFTTCCPDTGPQTANDSNGNYVGSGNVINISEAMHDNAKIVIATGKMFDKSEHEIIIGLMTGLGEGNLLNLANDGKNWNQTGSSNVPPSVLQESLNYPHDSVGHDAASVGIMQQQVGYWGEIEDLMIPAYQAGQFYAEMENKSAGDEYPESERGDAAATIQVNKPGRSAYDSHEGLAKELYETHKDATMSVPNEKHAERGYKNRKNNTSAPGNSGDREGSKASSPRNAQDRALNGGCGVSNSIRRHNKVQYNEGDAMTIVEAARDQIGMPYSWGGGNANGPSYGTDSGANTYGFDCSGLTQYAAAQAGINIPRHTSKQAQFGKQIGDISDAKPGDLIHWEEHVGVYSGDGMVIHAPYTGATVTEVPVFSGVIGITRIASDQVDKDGDSEN